MSHPKKKKQLQNTLRNAFLRVRHLQSMCAGGRNGSVKQRQGAWFTLACGVRKDRGGGAVFWKQQETGLDLCWGGGGRRAELKAWKSSPTEGCVEKELLLVRIPTVWGQADPEGPLPNFHLTLASEFCSDLYWYICPIIVLRVLHSSRSSTIPVVPREHTVVREDLWARSLSLSELRKESPKRNVGEKEHSKVYRTHVRVLLCHLPHRTFSQIL